MACDGQTDTQTDTQTTWPRLCQPFQSHKDFENKTKNDGEFFGINSVRQVPVMRWLQII